MKKKDTVLQLLFLISVLNLYSQSVPLSDTLYSNENRNKIVIIPDPVQRGKYFKIKLPEREILIKIELLDLNGKKTDTSPILFSKMGMYMPETDRGDYLLKIVMHSDTIIKRIRIE